MSRLKRSKRLNELAINEFIKIYFDDNYPNTDYIITIKSQNPLQLKINHKKNKYNWILYSASITNDLLNAIKIKIFRKHIASYKIQQWWKKIFYNPNNKFIEPFLFKNINKLIKKVI